MSKAKPEKPAGPVVLTANVLVDGRFIPAGDPTPFTEASLPAHLKQYIATGQEDFFHPRERDFYNNPQPDCGVVFQQTGGGGQWRQARQVAAGMEQQAWAEEQVRAANELPEETQAALADIHDRASKLARAQIQFNRDQTDIAYERAEADVREREERQQLYVRRGGAWGRVQNCQLRPGETCFVRRENGQMEASGFIDATGEPPPSEVIT